MTPTEIREWRAAQGMTQEQLAEALGVHTLTVSYWERGKQEPPPYLHRALRDIECERGRKWGGSGVMQSDYWRENRRRRQEAARTKRPCIDPACPAKVWPEDEKCHYCGAPQPFAAREKGGG